MPEATVRVVLMEELLAIRMTWDQHATSPDVTRAFKQINTLLEESDSGLYVVVDLLSHPVMPMGATIQGALFGPYQNRKLKEWLIVGKSPMGKLIERTLASVTGRQNVRWFNTIDEASSYIVDTISRKEAAG